MHVWIYILPRHRHKGLPNVKCVRVCVRVRVRVRVGVGVRVRVRVCACVRACARARVCVYMPVYMYVYVSIHIHRIHVYRYACTFMCTQVFMHAVICSCVEACVQCSAQVFKRAGCHLKRAL